MDSTLGIATGTNAFLVSGGTINFQVKSSGVPAQRGLQFAACYTLKDPSDGAFQGNLVTAGARSVQYRHYQPAGPNSGFTASGRIDNFTLSTAVPEPSFPILISVCGGLILLRRRRA